MRFAKNSTSVRLSYYFYSVFHVGLVHSVGDIVAQITPKIFACFNELYCCATIVLVLTALKSFAKLHTNPFFLVRKKLASYLNLRLDHYIKKLVGSHQWIQGRWRFGKLRTIRWLRVYHSRSKARYASANLIHLRMQQLHWIYSKAFYSKL